MGIQLSWPAIDCPKQEEVKAFLEAMLAAGKVPEARIETASVAPGRIELRIATEGKTVLREIELAGECDGRAAMVAAVIEKVLSAGTVKTTTIAELVPFAVERLRPISIVRDVGWIGAHGDLGVGTGGAVGGGFAIEGGWRASDPIALALRASYRLPERQEDVRVDQGRAEVRAVWTIVDALAIDGGLFLQLVFAERPPKRAFRPNPGASLGLRYRFDLGPLGIELGLVALIPFRSQRFLVDGLEIARLPQLEAEASLGISYGF